MRLSDEARARKMYAADPLRYAAEASDYGWSVITGMCGGCGSETCHEGACDGARCRTCPERGGLVPADMRGAK